MWANSHLTFLNTLASRLAFPHSFLASHMWIVTLSFFLLLPLNWIRLFDLLAKERALVRMASRVNSFKPFGIPCKMIFLSFMSRFYNRAFIPSSWEKTHLIFIPKLPNPIMVRDFRPITLCNVSYHIPSKGLANRLKQTLPNLISLKQSAFLKGA